MKKQYLSLLLLGIGLCLGKGTLAQTGTPERPLDKLVTAAKTQGLFRQSYSLFEVEKQRTRNSIDLVVSKATYLQMQPEQTQRLFHEHPGAVTLSIPTAATGTLELELVQQAPFDKNFFVSTNADINKPVAYTPGVYYRGVIKGIPQSTVAISVFENEIIGIAATPEQGNLVLGKLQTPGNQHNYILYSDRDLKAPALPACETEDPLGYTETIREYMNTAQKPTAGKCVKVYLECDYAMHQNKGGVTGATNYITAIFNNLAVLYANEQISTVISAIMVWTSQDPYSMTNTATALTTFINTRTTFNGDIAHLASLGNIGGRASLNVLCRNNDSRHAYSSIRSNFNTVPVYSWSVSVMTHEMGHNLGSPHTHSCSWPGGALDNCYPVDGTCSPGPAPVNGGTIMSYCHLTSTGINFNNGFGILPGNLIRNRVNAAACLSTCDTTPPPPPPACTTNKATLTIVLDNYPEETSWNIKNSANTIVASGGTYNSQPDGATITDTFCLPNGCYTLTMFDTYGDGICCVYGNGSYSLSNNATNTVLASGGQYGAQEVKTFCFEGGAPPPGGMAGMEEARAAFKVFPNPAKEVLHIRWNSDAAATATLTLTDLAGRKIAVYTTRSIQGSNNYDITLQQLPAGMYLLQLHTGQAQFQQKIMVQQR